MFDPSNNKKIKQIKNCYQNERVFLIGNGPSLNNTPLYLLKNEYTIAFNRFNLFFERLNWKPTFYSVIDAVVAKDMAEEINLIVPEVKYAFFPDIHSDGTNFKSFIHSKDNVFWLKPKSGDYTLKLPKIVFGGTVSFSAIQILIYMGFKEIVLIGVDMNYKIHTTVDTFDGNTITAKYDDDPNHFDPRYFGWNRSYHQPDDVALKNMFAAFEKAALLAKENNIKIINAGYNSAVKSFPKIEFESLFNYSRKEKLNLFIESLGFNGNFNSVDEAIPNLVYINTIDEWKDNAEYLAVDESLTFKLIKNKIETHIPFGPFEGMVIFKKRKS